MFYENNISCLINKLLFEKGNISVFVLFSHCKITAYLTIRGGQNNRRGGH